MLIIDNKFEMGAFVYIDTDPDQFRRKVIAIETYIDGSFLYKIQFGMAMSYHYQEELTDEPNTVLKTE